MRTRASLATLLLCTLLGGAAHARGGPTIHGYADAALGLSAPIGDDNWTNSADPTFDFQLRGGAAFYLSSQFAVAPELQLDFIPVNFEGGFQGNIFGIPVGADVSGFRFRFTVGARALYDFGIGNVYVRFGLGVDHFSQTVSGSIGGNGGSSSSDSDGFTLEPAVGTQFYFLKYGTAGLQLGFPISIFENNDDKSTIADITVLATIGFRY